MDEALYLDPKAVARRYGIPARTLMNWRYKRRGPVFYRVLGRVLYRVEDVENFIAAGMVNPKGGQRAKAEAV
ncbi:MAG: helix-turn-helix domain-containing protein [Candidatus Adiutrix sp.]|jgi:predicted site-specific integrase-resolvase|nr:helix-turn-helix domain-containing protein [Candidatus Adiutrix sp.]